MDSGCDIIAYAIDIAIGSADSVLDTVEAVFHARVNCVEAVAEPVGDTTELSVYVLVIEAFEEVRASDCALYCGVANTISTKDTATAEYCEPYEVDEPFVTG